MAHSLFSTALIVYCFACYAFLFYWVRVPCSDGDDLWLYCKAQCSERPIRGWSALALAFVFLAPLIVPYAFVICVRDSLAEAKNYRKLLRVHKPFAFIWLNPAKLPAAPRKYIDAHTPEMLEVGFEVIGTYVMKTILPNYYGRVFLHESGTTVSALCYLNGDTFFSYTTVFESGPVLETTPTTPSERMEVFLDNPRLTAHYATGEPIATAHVRHLEKVNAIFAETNDRPLVFPAEQACDVLEYESCVFSRELFELGRLDESPPEAVLPAGVPLALEPACS